MTYRGTPWFPYNPSFNNFLPGILNVFYVKKHINLDLEEGV